MVIQNMFVEDINRKINGVVKVDEDENKVLEQELNEYVITRELKRHFADFFNTYAEARTNGRYRSLDLRFFWQR